MQYPRLILSACVLLILPFLSCNQDAIHSQTSLESQTNIPSQRDLGRKIWQQKKITFVYSGRVETYRTVLDSIRHPSFQMEKTFLSSLEVKASDLQNTILFLIGSPQTNTWVSKLKGNLPLDFQDAQFRFDNETYNDPLDILKVNVYPNPESPEWPIYLMTGNSDQAILDFLREKNVNQAERLYGAKGYEVFRRGDPQVFGYFNETTWAMDKVVHFDFRNQVDTTYQTEHYTFLGKPNTLKGLDLHALAEQCEKTYQAITSFVGKAPSLPVVNYHLFASMEEKGLQLSNTNLAHYDLSRNCVFVVANERLTGQWDHPEHDILLRHLLGKPALPVLETGLRIYFSEQWQKKGFQHWAKQIYQSGNLPGLSHLLDPQKAKDYSPLIYKAASASLVDFLVSYWGKSQFLTQYSTWSPSGKAAKTLERKWQQHIVKYQSLKAEKNLPIPYCKGFNFAHEGYRIYNGYGSQLAKQSLHKLAQLGTNAVAIVPYSFMRNPNKPTPLNIDHRAGSENDESVLTAHFNAKDLGMTTLLKPQIWLGSSWPGDVEMKNEEDWQRFFEYYTNWIIHYALLAEMYEFDALCIGVEFAKATIQRPEDWKTMIRKVRGIFHGKITYAANWGAEFEQLSFWEELDFIGLDCYYPLNEGDSPTKKELAKRFSTVLNKVERVTKQYNKPFLFTEIGFRSVDTPWKNPHDDPKGRPFSAEAQNLCYEVVFEGIQDKAWIHGLFWWKWPSYLNYGGRQNTSFTPNRKLAEETVKKWFEEME